MRRERRELEEERRLRVLVDEPGAAPREDVDEVVTRPPSEPHDASVPRARSAPERVVALAHRVAEVAIRVPVGEPRAPSALRAAAPSSVAVEELAHQRGRVAGALEARREGAAANGPPEGLVAA